MTAALEKPRFRFRLYREHGLLLLFLVILGCFSLTTKGFLDLGNITTRLQQEARMGVLAAGMTLVILTGGIDLSVGSAVALAAMVLGVTWDRTHSGSLAIGAALITGGICGALNGALTAGARVPALIVTLATLSVYRGLAFAVGGSNSVGGFPPEILSWGKYNLANVPVPIWIAGALLIGPGIYLARTDGGRAVYAVGANAAAARLSGVPVRALLFRIYVVSGLLAGVAAVLWAGYYNTVRADIGRNDELTAITIVVLGGTSVTGGEGSMLGTALGFLTLVFIGYGAQMNGWPSELQGLVVAVLLIGALLLDAGFRKRVRGR